MDEKLEIIKNAVGEMVKMIIGNGKSVHIVSSQRTNAEKGDFTLIVIRVDTEDIPRCIGRKGMVAESIRLLAIEVAKKNDYKKNIFIRVDAPNFEK